MLRCLSKCVLCTIIFMVCAVHPAKAAVDKVGWDLLWNNKFDTAERQFKKDVKADPKDASAWRGLGWVSYVQDDRHTALADWGRAIQLAPADWTTPGIWAMLDNMSYDARDFDSLVAAARVLVSTPGVRPELTYSARLILAHDVDRRQSIQAGAPLRKPFGFITLWQVIGPFDNISKSGFDKTFPPEQKVDLSATYNGKDDGNVVWRTCPLVDRDCTVSVGAYLGDSGADIYYAATAVDVDADVDAIVRYEAVGASKIYIGGKLVHKVSAYRSAIDDVQDAMSFPTHLVKGWNVILVKLADDENSTADFDLRITDSKGAPIKLDDVDPAHASGAVVDADTTVSSVGAPVDDWLTASVADHQDSVEGCLLLAEHATQVGDFDRTETRLRAALAEHPDCALLHWELSEVLDADGQSDDAIAERTAVRKSTHEIEQVELTTITSDAPPDNASARVKAARDLAHLFPWSDNVTENLISALKTASFTVEAYRLARAECRRNGDKGATVVNLADAFEDDDAHASEVLALLKFAVDSDPTYVNAIDEYGRLLYRDSKYALALVQYQHAVANEPETPDGFDWLATAYEALGNRKQALVLHRRFVALRPQDASAYSTLGDALVNAGLKSEAVVQYRAAIALNPSLVDLRDKLQLLTGQKPVIDCVAPVPTPDLDKLRGKPSTTASITYIVDDGREVVYPDFATQGRWHQVIRINDQSAVATLARFALDRESGTATVTVESARLFKADGKIEDHTNDESQNEVDFPSLAPGDIIDVTYTAEDHSTGALSHNFWAEWNFGGPDAETEISRFALITPTGMDYDFASHGDAPAPQERNIGKWHVREWTARGLTLKEERLATPNRDWAPWVDVSNVKSWSQIVSWYEDLSSPRCVPDSAIRAKAAEITQGATTDDEKIKRLVRYVSHDVQYQSTPFRMSAYIPTEGKEVIRERYGDCKDKAALLTAMLSTLGIHSRMVLLSPRYYGVTPYLPSPRFAHAIALVDTPEGVRFIDGTADGLDYLNTPWPDQGVPALVIDPKTDSLQTTPYLPASLDASDVSFVGSIDEKGSSQGDLSFSFTGNYGWALRNVLNQYSAEKQQEILRTLTVSLCNLVSDKGDFDGLKVSDTPLIMRAHGVDSTLASPAGNFLIVGLPWSSLSDQSEKEMAGLTSSGRLSDLNVSGGGSSTYHVELKLPNGYQPEELPDAIKQTSAWGSYTMTCAFQDGKLIADFTEEDDVMVVKRADVDGFAAFMKKKLDDMETKIVFKKS